MRMQQDVRRLAQSLSSLRLSGSALLLALTLIGLAGCWMILRDHGPLAIAGLLLTALLLAIFVRWQRGVYALLAYLPFSGLVTISLLPWHGWPALHPVLYKDWLFVVPSYLGFLMSLVIQRERLPRLPPLLTINLLVFNLIVIAQAASPGVPNILTALIGAKVWLFYIPLCLLAYSLVASTRSLWLLFRFLILLTIFPCAAGIVEYVLAQSLGYAATMDAIYGPIAASVTQGYTNFRIGGGVLPRIPSTFTFVSQYFGFTLAMLVPCYVVWRSDPSSRWRWLARWTLLLVTIASFLSGARAAFLFVPILLALMYGLDRGFPGGFRAVAYIGISLLGMLTLARITAVGMFEHVSELFGNYAVDTAYGGLVQALSIAPLGTGTGTNTGPARYAFERPEFFVAIQNYYAKVVYELGLPGLLLVCTLFVLLIREGFRARRSLQGSPLRVPASAILAFVLTMALNSFKGWLLDLDPINVYFWVFTGLLVRLTSLAAAEQTGSNGPSASKDTLCAFSTQSPA